MSEQLTIRISLFALVLAYEVEMVHNILQNLVLRVHWANIVTNRTMVDSFGDITIFVSFREVFTTVFA